jgi:tetratricopeptide (TPR) repeat protein
MPSTNSTDQPLRDALNRAIELNRQGKHRACVKLLLPLLETHPRSAAVYGYLGGAYFELGDYDQSTECFRKAARLSPKSELASLGLFHSLWNQDALSEAFDEMKRFLSITDSKEYQTLLRDMAIEGRLAPKPRAMALAK